MDFDVGEILVIKPSLLLAHSNVITIIKYFQLTLRTQRTWTWADKNNLPQTKSQQNIV